MDPADPIDDEGTVDTRPDIQTQDIQTQESTGSQDLLARAARIRERSHELIEALGEDHPLVGQARRRAEALEHQALHPDRIDLR